MFPALLNGLSRITVQEIQWIKTFLMGRKYGCLRMEAAVFWYLTLYQISSEAENNLIQRVLILPCSIFKAHQYRSLTVNVLSSSRMRRVFLVSLGMRILPGSSPHLTIPVSFLYLLSSQLSNYDAGICKARGFIHEKTICIRVSPFQDTSQR